MIRTAGGEVSGTFRLYDGDTHVGYVLTMPKPGEGPHWTRPLGYQGRTVNGTVAEWGETKDGAMGFLLVAYRAETDSAG
jgi:hypothetical protein